MKRVSNSLELRRRRRMARRARFARRGRQPFGFEQLERRHLLAAVSWTGLGDGTSWHDPNNWSGQALPGQADDVTINAPAGTTINIIHGDDGVFINSLVSNSPIFDDGSLQVATTAQMSANVTVSAQVGGGTWTFSNGAVMNTSGFFTAFIGGLTLNGNLDASNDALFTLGDLTLNGTMFVGNSSGTTFGVVNVGGFLGGSGSILFGASASNSIRNDKTSTGPGDPAGTLTIEPNLLIHGQNGSITSLPEDPQNNLFYGSIVNEGTINADVAGGTITVGHALLNQGMIEATQGGTVTWIGHLDNQSGGVVSANGGTVSAGTGQQCNNEGLYQATNGGNLTLNNLINAAGATVSVDSSTLTLTGGFIQNQGTITETNSTVNLAGEFSQAGLGNFLRNGGTVNVSGQVDGDIVLNSTTGPWNFIGNVILQNGQITENDGVTAGFAATGQILQGMTIKGDLNLTLAQSGFLYVLDSLTVTGNLRLGNASGTNSAAIYLGSGASNFGEASRYSNSHGLHISNNTKLTVGGQIIFGPSIGNAIVNNNLHIIPEPGPNDPPAVGSYFDGTTTTYYGGSNIEIAGAIVGGSGQIYDSFSRSSIQIDTSLVADGANSAFFVGGSNFLGVMQNTLINVGTLEATNGASLTISDLSQSTGTVSVTNGALRLSGSLANSSTITATNSSVDLNGTFTQAGLGTFNRTGSIVNLSGTVEGGLAIDANTGSWYLHGGTIDGGTVTETGGAELAFTQFGGFLGKVTNGVTSHVTFNGDMDLDAGLNASLQQSPYVYVYGGLTLNGTMYVGNAADSEFGSVYFGDNLNAPGSLDGNGTVVFSGTRTDANLLANGWQGPGTQTFTIGPNITIRGRSGSVTQVDGTKENSIVLQGTVSADTAGGTIQLGKLGSIAPVINEGSIQATGGGTISGTNLVNSSGKTITVTDSTFSLDRAWSNAGTIVSTNSTLNLGGSFTRATLGNFVRRGGTVNIKGTLSGGLNLDATNGSWTLLTGTINGGAVNTSGGSQLILSSLGGTLTGVTINGSVDATQQEDAQATFKNGLVLNGTITLGAGNLFGTLTFGAFNAPAGSLTGNGAIIFASNVGNGNTIDNGSNLAGAAGTLTIGPNITIHGKTGVLSDDFATGTIINQGKIIAEDASGTISIGTGNGTFSNQGTMQANSGAFRIGCPVSIDGHGTLATNWAGSITALADISGNSTAFASSNPQGVLTLSAGSSAAHPQLLEAMSQDLGATPAGFKHNSVYGTIIIGTANVKLVDQFDNAPGAPDALYVDSLVVSSFTQLDLNGIHVYARAVQIGGAASVINGTITQLPDGGAIDINSPLPGAISPVGNQDTWTFFGRAGEAVTAYVNPGTGTAPAPIVPNLGFANVQLIAPNNAVLASGNSASLGAAVSFPNIILPTDGVYSIKISDSDGRTNDTGNYIAGVWDVSAQDQPLLIGENTNGSINTPFDIQNWAFSALAGEQVRLHINNETSAGLLYSLTGPNGFVGFSNLSGDSPLVNLTQTGGYTLSVQGQNGATGNYSFVVNPTTQTSVPLNGSINGTLVGSGQAELYTVNVPTPQILTVSLDDQSSADSNEMYLRFGAPPTRETFDYRYSTASGSDQTIFVPQAATGTWYVLVYGANVPVQSNFSLSTVGEGLQVAHATPSSLGNSAPAVMEITGAGFLPGTSVSLVGTANTEFPASSVSVVSFTQLRATVPANLPPGVYSIRVSQGALSRTLQNGFTVTAGGAAHLDLGLDTPDALGRHIPATIYVTYSNSGTVAMPAPVLELSSDDPAQRPLLTLDSTKIAQGLYTYSGALPDGFHNTIEFLASGAIPGLLMPGESVTVPVYYAGLQQPWDFSKTTVPLLLSGISTSDTGAIDWSTFKSDLKPSDIPELAWDRIYSNLTTELGSTAGQYVAALDSAATYLGSVGENITDIDQLWFFLYLQASDSLGASGVMPSGTDADVSLPGNETLTFARAFQLPFAARDSSGILGYGWSASYQASLSFAADGSIDLSTGAGGFAERFQPNSRGGYFSLDPQLTLTLNGDGSYTLMNADGRSSNFTASGRLAYEQDTNGNHLAFGYNGLGQLIDVVASSGQLLTFGYNAAGRLASVSDSVGRVTSYSYDPSNQYLLSVTGPGGTTSYSYDPASNGLASVTSPSGVHVFYTYDAQGRLSGSSMDGGMSAISYAYTAAGEVSATDAAGVVRVTDYDVFARPVKTIDGLGDPTYATYDAQGNLLSLTDALGDVTSFTYDSVGNLTGVSDPLLATDTFTYGANSRLTLFDDANHNDTRFVYDANGNVLTATYADGASETRTYDPLGDAVSFINRNGLSSAYAYDSFGQLTRQTFADGSHDDYTYDAHENLLTATDTTGTTTFTYDSADRLTGVSYPGGRSLTFTYDAGGRRIQMVDQSGYTINYVYTPAGELSKLTDVSDQPIVTYAYDAAGRLSEQDNANGTFTTYQYDGAGRVAHLINHAPGGAVNSRSDYTYNALGEATNIATLDGAWSYTYDAAGQLTRAVFTSTNPSLQNQDLAYNYDAAGNRTSTVINGATTVYVINAMNEYASIGGVQRQYDADGNLLFDGTSSYTYDQLDELASISNAIGTTQYTYNALGERAAAATGGQSTQYLIDPAGLGSVVSTYDGAGALLAHFDYGLSLADQAAAAGGRFFYDFDSSGSTVGTSDASGSYINSYRYLPFGQVLFANVTVPNEFQFGGAMGVQSGAGGLIFMRARYYNPGIGRFMTSDPAGLSGGDTNFYRYAMNQPQQIADPSGFDNELTWGEIISQQSLLARRDSLASYGGGQPKSEGENFVNNLQSYFHDYLMENDPEYAEQDLLARRDSLISARQVTDDLLARRDALISAHQTDDLLARRNALISAHHKTQAEVDQELQDFLDWRRREKEYQTRYLHPVPDPNRIPKDPFFERLKKLLGSVDPNDKLGPGFGDAGYVPESSTLPYRIDFENDPTASAPAQQVVITDQLNANVDWSSFRITEVGWGDTEITVPANSQFFQTTVPMTFNGETFNVLVEIGINLANGLITAQFFSIDPTTSLPPDVLTGFLPPEDGTGRGMGHVSYTVSPKTGLPTGTQIRNVADVSFDAAPIIATNQVSETDPTQGTDPAKEALVTIDAGPPTSTVAPLPPQETTPNFTVSWSGRDDAGGSGIAVFDVFVQFDGGPFVPFLTDTTATSATFDGAARHTYGFYSVATDNVGHREPTPASAQATTTVVAQSQLIVSSNADSGQGTLRQALLDANNSSGSPHTIQFQLPTGSQTIALQSPLPTATDPLTLSFDATQNVTLVPSAGAVWTDNQSLSITGSGSFTVDGGIEGAGNLSVGAGGNLKATNIIQWALVIGGSDQSPAVVTIAASDSSGNPLTTLPSSSEAAPSVGVVRAASCSSSTGAGAEAGTSRPVAMPSSFTKHLSDGTSPRRLSFGNRSSDAVMSLLAAFNGIGSTELTRLVESGGSRPQSDWAPRPSLSPNVFAASGDRAWLDAVFSADFEASGEFRLQWLGADPPPPADDPSALGLVENLFDFIGAA